MTTFTVEIAATTNVGAVRTENEDSVHVAGWTASTSGAKLHQHLTAPCVLAVIDGMGGHPGGATASRVASAALADLHLESATSVEQVNSIVQSVSDTVQEVGAKTQGYTIMGATIAGVVLAPEDVFLFNAGDCSILRRQEDAVVELASIDRDSGSFFGNLTQGLGGRSQAQTIDPHGQQFSPADQDLLVLCSDGLTDSINKDQISPIVQRHCDDLPTLADELVAAACEAGGRDNISIIVARFTEQR